MQEPDHRRLRVEHRLVHVDVDHLRAALHLLARDLDRAREVAGENELGESARAGDVGPLADVDEQRVVVDVERLETGEPEWRETCSECLSHARPESRRVRCDRGSGDRRLRGLFARHLPRRQLRDRVGDRRGCAPASVPQQPPTMLTKPFRAKSSISLAVVSGVSS